MANGDAILFVFVCSFFASSFLLVFPVSKQKKNKIKSQRQFSSQQETGLTVQTRPNGSAAAAGNMSSKRLSDDWLKNRLLTHVSYSSLHYFHTLSPLSIQQLYLLINPSSANVE